jgi:hypothetical protein
MEEEEAVVRIAVEEEEAVALIAVEHGLRQVCSIVAGVRLPFCGIARPSVRHIRCGDDIRSDYGTRFSFDLHAFAAILLRFVDARCDIWLADLVFGFDGSFPL